MSCYSTSDSTKNTTTLNGTLVSGHELKPGDKFRALGPIQTVSAEGSNHGVLHATPGDYHYIGTPTSPAPPDTAKAYILIERPVPYPSYWPAKPGDVWRNVTSGVEYFVGSGRPGSFLLTINELEQHIRGGSKFQLMHRRGRKLGGYS